MKHLFKLSSAIPWGLGIFTLMPSSCGLAAENEKRSNIIIIYADDLGYGDLETYGGDIPSPNIQRIADAGIKFTDFYVSAPACTPSRYSLLTGNYPQRSLQNLTGALMPEHTGHIDPSEKLLPAYLEEHGNRAALFGKWHLGNSKPEHFPHYGKSYPAEMPDNTIILSKGVRQGVEYANTLQAPARDIERFARVEDIFWQYRNERAYRRGDWKLYGDELYDLRKDIGEENNLVNLYPEVFNDLQEAHQEKLNSIFAEPGDI